MVEPSERPEKLRCASSNRVTSTQVSLLMLHMHHGQDRGKAIVCHHNVQHPNAFHVCTQDIGLHGQEFFAVKPASQAQLNKMHLCGTCVPTWASLLMHALTVGMIAYPCDDAQECIDLTQQVTDEVIDVDADETDE